MKLCETFGCVFLAVASAAPLSAQAAAPAARTKEPAPAAASAKAAGSQDGARTPEDYVIGPDDVLTVTFWREKDLSTDVVVRPDGKITLPLLNDISAAGLTPDQLRERILGEAARYLEDPAPSVVVKGINSRKVFITGEVAKPGPYLLTAPTSVLQLIAMAGGLQEFAQKKDIMVVRSENGRQITFPFDYAAVARRKNLQQNILLRPGDTVVVP
jgi:polysaccharide export outer membrane protein